VRHATGRGRGTRLPDRIGAGRVAGAAPDGCPIAIGIWSTHVVNPAIYSAIRRGEEFRADRFARGHAVADRAKKFGAGPKPLGVYRIASTPRLRGLVAPGPPAALCLSIYRASVALVASSPKLTSGGLSTLAVPAAFYPGWPSTPCERAPQEERQYHCEPPSQRVSQIGAITPRNGPARG
jgi:hypothetical protein